jgi:hypothetical protein
METVEWIIKDVEVEDRDKDAVVHKRIWKVTRTDDGEYTENDFEIRLMKDGALIISEHGGDDYAYLRKEHADLLREILCPNMDTLLRAFVLKEYRTMVETDNPADHYLGDAMKQLSDAVRETLTNL